jgi:hypothetical protein
VGNDILLALEYFAILYSPDQLVFESFGGYLRVKMWSDYFTHRARIAHWVVQRILTKPSRHSHSFVTSPSLHEELFVLNSNKPIDVLDGDLSVDPARYGNLPSRAVVYEFFNDEEEGNDENDNVDELMREDFCSFVQASLPGINVSFSRKMVTTSRKEEVMRAVLRIHLGNRSMADVASCSTQSKKSLPTPSLSDGSPVFSTPTANTQPMTPSTLGDLSVDQRRLSPGQSHAIFLRRSQTEKSSIRKIAVLDEVSVERPHDEVTPNHTPLRVPSPFVASPWRHDEPSVDHPRETIQNTSWESFENPTEFVRSLSEKIIRKTLADMDARDTIDHGHSPRVGTSFTGKGSDFSNTPSDEAGHGLELAKWINSRKTGTTDDGVKRNLLPTLEEDRNHDRARAAQVQDRFDPYQPCKLYGNAPFEHVRVNHARECDETVLSVLTNPTFNESRQTMYESKTMSRQHSFTSDFQTTVDALSATDEQSVQIAEREETTPSRKVRRPSSRRRYKVDNVEDDESIKLGCIGYMDAIYDEYCAPVAKNGGGRKRKNKVKLRGKDWASEGTPRTSEESDQDDNGDWGRKSSTSEATTVSGGEAIPSLGTLATLFIDGILENMGAVKISAPDDGATSKKTPQKRKVQGASKKRLTTFGEDWNCSQIVGAQDDDDAADDIISKLSNRNTPTDTFRQRGRQTGSTDEKCLPPRPTSGRSSGRKPNRTPVRTAVRPQPRSKAEPQMKSNLRQGDTNEKVLAHIHETIQKGERPISKKRTESVMKNLELLKDMRGSNGGGSPVGRKTATIKIISYDSTEVVSQGDAQETKRGGRKGLLGFRRKK